MKFNLKQHIKHSISKSWSSFLHEETGKPYFTKIFSFLNEEKRNSREVYPPPEQIFAAFDQVEPQDIRVVVLGQDPYHGPNQAHGYAFSVPDGVKTPPSLKNIFKEMESDIGELMPLHGNLTKWAEQGVLLLNTSLTVAAHEPASHSKIGWEIFTNQIIAKLSQKNQHLVFILWGNHARIKKKLIDPAKHLILESSHPSPLSCYRGFFGSKPFSKTNSYLKKHMKKTIDWKL
jgi:uracil-DNA glycosylase